LVMNKITSNNSISQRADTQEKAPPPPPEAVEMKDGPATSASRTNRFLQVLSAR
jgi:hypothetical protein